ncbi:DUF4369 domain-containing protein [Hymenobacter elongatus]|uniref:DUF4369 domain-containing protein n=1 Tax=Hymenobacter elongatus TaxID=877208 RepID=A0A4Z0PI72_9BACT|nr:DUF4369 domain-containing protein [Hymenobacter elongatus]TGE14455.1 DUF4369 domain-containing protein [Hymenobacter elongatus]
MHTLRLFLLCALLLPAGTGRAQNSAYRIVGRINGLADGTRMYLIDGSRRKFIDSATVRAGQFTLTGQLPEPVFVYLHAGRGQASRKMTDILLDNQHLTVEGSQPEYDSVRVRGSLIDQQWKAWLQEDRQLGHRCHQIDRLRQALLAKNDRAAADAQTAALRAQQQQRVRLLKAYVSRYHDSATGAALPTFCTLSDYLTRRDYLEMYALLTPVWQQSTLGQEILRQATQKGN